MAGRDLGNPLAEKIQHRMIGVADIPPFHVFAEVPLMAAEESADY